MHGFERMALYLWAPIAAPTHESDAVVALYCSQAFEGKQPFSTMYFDRVRALVRSCDDCKIAYTRASDSV